MDVPRSPQYRQIIEGLADSNAWLTFDATEQYLDSRLPAEADRDAFDKWLETKDSNPPELVTSVAVVDLVKSIDFATRDWDLHVMLRDRSPYVPVGILETRHFRLWPYPHYLQSEYDHLGRLRPSKDIPIINDGAELFVSSAGYPSSILSICFESAPQLSRQEYDAMDRSTNLSSNTARLKSADEISRPPLTFYQLGVLECYLGTGRAFEDRNSWSATDFAVVVEVKDNCKAGAIYIVYNFRREPEAGYSFRLGEDYDKEKETGNGDDYDGYEWGYLMLDSEEPFSCAKIAESIDDLGEDAKLELNIISRLQLKLTHVVWEARKKAYTTAQSKQSESRMQSRTNGNITPPNKSGKKPIIGR